MIDEIAASTIAATQAAKNGFTVASPRGRIARNFLD